MSIRRKAAIETLSSYLRKISPVAVVAAVGFIILASLSVSARAWLAHPASTETPGTDELSTTTATAAQASSQNHRGPVQVVRLTLYDAGIYPREVHVQSGLISISIEDLSGGTAGLTVARENAGTAQIPMGVISRLEGQRRGRMEFQVPPGRYVVSDTSRPNNRTTIIVEP